jgi:hypothetical protein
MSSEDLAYNRYVGIVPLLRTRAHKKQKKNITMADPIAGSSDMATVLITTPSRRSLRDGLIEEPIEGFYSII